MECSNSTRWAVGAALLVAVIIVCFSVWSPPSHSCNGGGAGWLSLADTGPQDGDSVLLLENRILKSAQYAYQNNLRDPKRLGDYVIDDARLTSLPENTQLKIIFVESDSAVHVYKEGSSINGLEDHVINRGFSKWIGDLSKFGGWLNTNRINMRRQGREEATTPTPLKKYKQSTSTGLNNMDVHDCLPPPPQHPTVQSYFSSVQSYLFNNNTAHFFERNPYAIKQVYNAVGAPLDIENHRAYLIQSNDLIFVISGDSSQIVASTDTLLSRDNHISNLYSFWRGSAWDKILKWRTRVLQIQ